MSIVRKILREPLVQFMIMGVLVFGAYSTMDRSPLAAGKLTIQVGKGQLAQMFKTFSKTWQRPPTEAEFKGLVDGYVKEEVFYREGQKMGLDQDDTVLRRRMQQKMEFLLEPSAEQLTPEPGELEAYLNAHAEKYRLPPQVAFRQIFFKSDRPGDEGETAAKQALVMLEAQTTADTSTMGDPTLLPGGMDLTSAAAIARNFDAGFTNVLLSVPTDQWFGPVRSQYGVHLVFVEEKAEGRSPIIEDVKVAVRSDWESTRRRELAESRYSDMREQYDVRIDWPTGMAAWPIETSGVE